MIFNRTARAACLWLSTSTDIGWICAWLSRLLIFFVAVELVTMPVTQSLWTWDKFLHGGQDFELGLLMVVICLCLTLLRAQHCRQTLHLLLACFTWLRISFERSLGAVPMQAAGCVEAAAESRSGPPSDLRTLPLLI